jgi:toxin ParE1/3/4
VPARRVRIHPEALTDLAEGRDAYARRSPVAATRFLVEIDQALVLVREAPERWALYRVGMRRFVMSSFPYSIIYHVDERTIDIYAVAHAKRRPLYWRNRRFPSSDPSSSGSPAG